MELIDNIATAANALPTHLSLRRPKRVATIKLCGSLIFYIDDTMEFTMPTEDQRKNLKEMLCIEVIPIEE